MACGGCFVGLFARPSRSDLEPKATSPVLLGHEHSQLQQLVRDAMREEVKLVRDAITKDLRKFEVRMSVAENQEKSSKRRALNVEHLQAQLLKTEELRRRRSLEAGTLRKVLDEVRTTFRPEDESDDASCGASSSRRSSKAPSLPDVKPQEVLEEVREERERWVAEREMLEEQIKEMEEQMERGEALPVYDPEKEQLKRSLKQLMMSIESRDRYGCWVCNMQKDEQDGSNSEESNEEEDEEEEDTRAKKKPRATPDSSDDDYLGEENQEALLHEQIAACAEELQRLQAEVISRSPSGSRCGTPRHSVCSTRRSPSASRESSPTRVRKSSIGARKDYVEVIAVPGATKSSRNRIATPFVPSDALLLPGTGAAGGAAAEHIADPKGAVKFSEAVSVDVRKVDPDTTIKRTRGRVATPFVQKDTLDVAESKMTRAIKFNREVDEEDAEVDSEPETEPRDYKRTRDRIATPYMTSDPLMQNAPATSSDQPNEKITFSEDVDIEVREIGDDKPPMRRCRERQATGFVTDNALMEMKRKVAIRDIQFSQEVEVTERELADSSKPLRRTRSRQATGFVTDEHKDLLMAHKRDEGSQPSQSVQISDAVSVETRSVAIGGQMRRCRDRKPTGHVQAGALAELASAPQVEFVEVQDKAVTKDLQFSRHVDVEEQDVADSSKPLRRSRGRQATGYVTQEASLEQVPPESASVVQISNDVSIESREVAIGGQMRRCRDRQATGFVTQAASLEHTRTAHPSTPSVQISDDVTVDSRAVTVGGQMRSCRERKATGFVTDAALTEHSKASLPTQSARSLAAVHRVAAKDLQFSEHVDVAEREVANSGHPLRHTRDRQSTGYATAEHESLMENVHRSPPPSSSVQISDDVSVEARDVTVGSQMRRCRDRQATGFVTEAALTEHITMSQPQASSSAKDLQFSHHVDVEERAVESSKPLRRTRDRQATGFVTNDALVEHSRGGESTSAHPSVRISDNVSTESREVASSGQLRSCRDRQSTGFVTDAALSEHTSTRQAVKEMEDKALAKELGFSQHVDVEDRVVPDTGKPMRSCRSRQATGFVNDTALSEHIRFVDPPSQSASVQISDNVSIETREVAASAQMRKTRNRQATGFVSDDTLDERTTVLVPEASPQRSLQWSQVVDVEEREVADSSQPLRRVRDRQATGFVTEDALTPPPAEVKVSVAKGLQFASHVDVEEREVADQSRPLRQTRTRQATGYATHEHDALMENAHRTAQPSSSSVRISDNVSVDTREVGPGGQMRRCRDRQSTGFVAGDALSQSQSVNFVSKVIVEERQVESSGKPMRSCRDRQATGFVTGDALTQPMPETAVAMERAVQFDRHVSVDDREVENSGVPMRSCRDRQSTGFVTPEALTTIVSSAPTAVAERAVQFQSVASVDEREVANSGAPMRSCRDRKPTGFVTNGALAEHGGVSFQADVANDKTVQFSGAVSVEEREADGNGVSMRSCRNRQATGFASGDAFNDPETLRLPTSTVIGDKLVQFQSFVSVDERDVDSPEKPMRSCRSRQATGFVHENALGEAKSLRFNSSADIVDAASDAPLGAPKSVRGRVVTPHCPQEDVFEMEPCDGTIEDFLGVKASPRSEVHAIRFNQQDDVRDAASDMPTTGVKSVRGRVATPYLPDDVLKAEPEEEKSIRFVDVSSVVEAASEVSGGSKSVRDRIATPFISKGDAFQVQPGEGKNIRFVETMSVVEAASEVTAGTKSVRDRIATPFMSKEDAFQVPPEEGKNIRFVETMSVVEAASEVTGGTKSVRDRIATPFMSKEDAFQVPPDEDRGKKFIRFVPTEIVVDAASYGADGDAKSLQDRIATPHLPQKALFEAMGNKPTPSFDDTAVVVDAASHAPVGEALHLRDRVATPHVWVSPQSVAAANNVRFMKSGLNVIVEAASESTGEERSVKDRIATPRVVGAMDPFDLGPHCHFSDAVENLSLNSDCSESDLRSVRDRVATPHASSKDMFSDEGVRFFTGMIDAVEPASAEPEMPFKSVRNRIATPRAPTEDVFEDSGSVRFGDLDGVEGHEAKLSKMRDRVQTPFIKKEDIEGTGVRYLGSDEIVNIEGRKDTEGRKGAKSPSSETRSRESGGTCSTSIGSECLSSPALTDTMSLEDHAGAVSDYESDRDHPERDHSDRRGSESPQDSDGTSVSRTSSCSSRSKRRSRLVTPFMSKENIGINDALASARMVSEESTGNDRTPKGMDRGLERKRTSERLGECTTPDSKEALDLKEASFESHSEREISVRVSRALQRKAQQDRCHVPKVVGHRKLSSLGILNGGNPEDELESHRVPAGQKDGELLRKTLHQLDFFEDLDKDSLEVLVEAMHVYQFADGEQVLRQGEKDGTHFFVVADGKFVVIKDGTEVAEMTSGSCFGESVLLLFGERSATVRARGSAKVYAMEGTEVREILRNHYKPMYESVTCCIDEIIKSRKVGWLNNLSAYQLQRIYDKARVETFEDGARIFVRGQKEFNAIYVVVNGCMNLSMDGFVVAKREKFGFVGDGGILNREASTTGTAEGTTKVLTLNRELLIDMFGDQLLNVLNQDRILSVIEHNQVLARLNEEQRILISTRCQMLSLCPGEVLDSTDVRFCILLHGAVSTQVEGEPEKRHYSVKRDGSCCFGDDHLVNSDHTWNIRVRSIGSIAKLGVWRTADLRDIFSDAALQDSMEMEDKMRVLQGIFLFRTLARAQLKRVASAMTVEHVCPGTPVFTQGDMGSEFYMIRRGLVQITIGDRSIRTLGIGDYFGERALLSREPRSATVTAVEASELWKMGDQTFVEIMQGPILEYLTNRINLQDTKISMEDLLFMRVIGRGGFGVVKMVCARRTHTRYALKCLRKRHVVEHQQQQELQNERSILAEVDHPFIIKYVRSFRSETQVYLLTELVTGGELLDILDVLGLLKRPQAQFYCGSLILALEFLHARSIAYLDLKSENCLVDHQGYIKMIDFGIAQRITSGKCHNVKGTPMFMAPEMILAKGYTTAADLWSLGVNLYEYMLGEFPFAKNSTNHAEIFKAVLKAPVRFPQWFKNQEDSEDCMSLMKGLLTRDPARRAGVEGYDALKRHAFFCDFSWDRLLSRQIPPPFIPQKEIYGEGGHIPTDGHLRDLVDEEAECAVALEDDGWRDPDPGWDDDFA